MTRRSKIWLAVAVLFTLVNLAGGVFAAAGGELLHAALHVALTLLGAYVALRIASRRGEGAEISAPPPALTDRLTNIEQSVEAVAIEVERIGEGQRFVTQLLAERREPAALSADPRR